MAHAGTAKFHGSLANEAFEVHVDGGATTPAELAYELSSTRKRCCLHLMAGDRRRISRLTVDTRDFAGRLVEFWLNARLIRTFIAGERFAHDGLLHGDTLVLKLPADPPRAVLDIRDFGAAGHGTLDTAAIQSAVDRCAADGGGVVDVPVGDWLIGTIILKSRVTLRLARGSRLMATPDLVHYPLQPSPHLGGDCVGWKGQRFGQALIYAHEAEDISVVGAGVIDGQGWTFAKAGYPGRPRVIQFVACRRATVDGISTRNSSSWTQHYIDCDDLVIRDVGVFSTEINRNNDGIDLEACRNVVVTGCTVCTDDDAYVFKGVSDRESCNILIIDCRAVGRRAGPKIGTESRGLFRNITIRNYRAVGTAGIGIYSVDRAVIENVVAMDLDVTDAYNAITIRLGNRDNYRAPDERRGTGSISNIWIDGLRVHLSAAPFARLLEAQGIQVDGTAWPEPQDRYVSFVCGIPDSPVREVTLRNIHVRGLAGGRSEADARRRIPENTIYYPGSKTFGLLPSHGLYLRHVQQIRLENVSFELAEPDRRPAVVLDDVQDLRLMNVEGTVSHLPVAEQGELERS